MKSFSICSLSLILGLLATYTLVLADGDKELAPYMARLQLYSQKLGYSIEAKNKPLTKFYHHEIEEVVETIVKDFPVHNEIRFPPLFRSLIDVELKRIEEHFETGDWTATYQAYSQLIANCNQCHTATAHGFIVITPAKGPSPYNQDFSVQPAVPVQ